MKMEKAVQNKSLLCGQKKSHNNKHSFRHFRHNRAALVHVYAICSKLQLVRLLH